jgi:hypothetical protein
VRYKRSSTPARKVLPVAALEANDKLRKRLPTVVKKAAELTQITGLASTFFLVDASRQTRPIGRSAAPLKKRKSSETVMVYASAEPRSALPTGAQAKTALLKHLADAIKYIKTEGVGVEYMAPPARRTQTAPNPSASATTSTPTPTSGIAAAAAAAAAAAMQA